MSKKSWGTIPAFLAALLCSAAGCLYVPAISYLSNAQLYTFTLGQLLLGMLPFLGAAFVLCSLLLLAANRVLGNLLEKGLQRAGKFKGMVSPLHILLLLLLFLVWLEGALLNRGLPQLTGEANLFSSLPRLLADSAVWLVVITLGLRFWRGLAKHFLFLVIGLCLLFSLGVADGLLTSQPRSDTAHISADEVVDRAQFHHGDNVLVLLLDAMSTGLVQDYLGEYPETADELDGFVMFQNNMETADSTQFSLPSILRGDVYSGGSVQEYHADMFTLPQGLPMQFRSAGYDVYASSTLSIFNGLLTEEGAASPVTRAATTVSPQLYGQLSIRFAPYALKNILANHIGYAAAGGNTLSADGNLSELASLETVNPDEIIYQALMYAANAKSAVNPTFHFHHINGTHKPYIVDGDGNAQVSSEQYSLVGLEGQNVWTWGYVRELLQGLKEAGLYDTTTIVLLGDHGDRLEDASRGNQLYARRAALLIKPANNHGALRVSNAATSNVDLARMLPAIHLEHEGLDALTTNLPAQRQLLWEGTTLAVYEGEDVTDLRLIEELPVEQVFTPSVLQEGKTYFLSNLHEDPSEIAYPLDYENANYTNGWGLRALEASMQCSFLVEAAPGSDVALSLRIDTAAMASGYLAFAPYDLVVYDKVSGREYEFVVTEGQSAIFLDRVTVSDASALQLTFEMNPFLDPQEMQISLMTMKYTGMQS